MKIKEFTKNINYYNGNKKEFSLESRKFLDAVAATLEPPNRVVFEWLDALDSGVATLYVKGSAVVVVRASHIAQLKGERQDGVFFQVNGNIIYKDLDSTEVSNLILNPAS